MSDKIIKAYDLAKQRFAAFGVDTDKAIDKLAATDISLHCWQGDDITGFEGEVFASQNVVTGNYPGKARDPEELRADMVEAMKYSPSGHKINLHSIYAEPKKKTDRKDVKYEDFAGWVKFAKEQKVGLDFNVSFFAHPMMDGTMSLSSRDKKVRDYWIEAAKGGREISYQMGKELGVKCMHNIWIPDGMKDMPASRAYYRALLTDSLDKIFEKKYDKKYMADSLEGKLFGIGTEVFVVGSHDFYLSYAIKNNIGITMDTGHYHPTEQVYDKISAVAPFVDDIQLHVSRGVRWDSDHVVTQSDELSLLFLEIARNGLFDKVHIGLDYFDASINRVIAWAVGLRATGKAILSAYLEPTDLLTKAEAAGDFSSRLALHEEIKNLPVNAVWDMACLKKGMPEGSAWIAAAKKYESDVLLKRK